MTCRQALQNAAGLGLDRLDAQLLLLHALGRPDTDRAWLLTHDDDALDPAATQTFEGTVQRRANGEPLAYIVGHKEFYGLRLDVDARVLVPRPDTETLVSWALELLQSGSFPPHPQVLDLGTGSGAIAIAIAHQLEHLGPKASVLAVDASPQALAVAQQNARRLAPDVSFIDSNWFEKVSACFHLIVSNPPYIVDGDPHMAALGHEPASALTSGVDGLDDIRRIIDGAPAHLESGGWLLLEHGYDQAGPVQKLLEAAGFGQVQSRDDLAGIARCSGGQWRPKTGVTPETQTAG